MSDKHLSGEEKRRRLKEQFKKELKERQEFVNKVKGLRKMQSINKALSDMSMDDDSEEWIEQLDRETAMNEAKTEMALETARAAEEAADREAEFQMSEAEMQKLSAEQMVARMKAQMAAEAEGTTLEAEEEDEGEVPVNIVNEDSTRGMIDIEVSESGEVTEAESPAKETDQPEGPVRRMMDGFSNSAETE